MDSKISKTNEKAEYFNARIDEIQMGDVERFRAKAQLARAEAFADAVARLFRFIQRAGKSLADHTYHRPTATHS